MIVSFKTIQKGHTYSRKELAQIWGYKSTFPLERGVVTPRYDNKIILFVTEDKPPTIEQYKDRLDGQTLYWEGPNDHFAEKRTISAQQGGDEIHLFFRKTHLEGFTYLGTLQVVKAEPKTDRPSRFEFRVK